MEPTPRRRLSSWGLLAGIEVTRAFVVDQLPEQACFAVRQQTAVRGLRSLVMASILDPFSLAGRRALVTGGSRGLGKEIAIGLAQGGAELVLVGRERASLDQAAAELAGLTPEVATLVGDMSVPEEAEETARRAVDEYGPIDVLVNNVGGRRFNVPTEEMTSETWRAQLDLNVTSAFVCTKIVGGEMVKRRSGRIVNVG